MIMSTTRGYKAGLVGRISSIMSTTSHFQAISTRGGAYGNFPIDPGSISVLLTP